MSYSDFPFKESARFLRESADEAERLEKLLSGLCGSDPAASLIHSQETVQRLQTELERAYELAEHRRKALHAQTDRLQGIRKALNGRGCRDLVARAESFADALAEANPSHPLLRELGITGEPTTKEPSCS